MDPLQLCVAGEASVDTPALVEQFLRQDPELHRRLLEGRLDPLIPAGAIGSPLSTGRHACRSDPGDG